jgi:hypothetical protein
VKALEDTMCEEKELLVSYLYDDLGDAERARFDAHLRTCAECRDEVDALRGVRADLISWSPPQPDFGFRVVREPKVVEMKPRGAAWRAWWTPAAGLAAAAVLVLAAASAIARVEVRGGPDGFTVRTGWGTAPAADTARGERAAAPQNVSLPAPDESRAPLTPPEIDAIDPATVAAIEARLRALESAARGGGVRATASAGRSDAEILRDVHDLIAQSESRQLTELARRIAQVIYDTDQKRAGDLAAIRDRFARIDALTAGEEAAHRDLAKVVFAQAQQK